ncbi:uncharacterized protein LOC132405607 [Hypanus sabinus]|uniref:uncharacterized protein LOC132405607 n=1 Tax=Hypanus sabinus TaxID=79690 RepID=UPI0028C3B57E|nr:uncharacterized protein LOC132405607 [Hypanus sabinus]
MLCDRLVCSVNNDTKRCLLGETPPLTFKTALEIAQGMELAADNAKDIQKGYGGSQSTVVLQIRRETGRQENWVECFQCGGTHYANTYKFKDTVCHACGKKRHFIKKCRSIKGKVEPGQATAQQAQAASHHLGEEDEEAVCAYNMLEVEMDEGPPEPYYATVTVKGKDIKFEIDSGATALVIIEETYRRTWGSNLPPIRPPKLQLRTYTGQPIPHLGVLYVDILAGGQKAEARLVIAKGSGPSFLGRNWLHKIRLNWHEFKYARMTEEHEVQRADEVTDGNVSDRHSPDTFESELAVQLAALQPITGAFEVTPSALKASTPLLVWRSSDPALVPPAPLQQGASQPDDPANRNLHVKPIVTVANGAPADDVRTEPPGPPDKHSESTVSNLTKKVEFSGGGGPLGIHVVPCNSTLSGRFLSLSIRGIEENSHSRKENLLQESECIIKINDCDLTDKTFDQAQEVY